VPVGAWVIAIGNPLMFERSVTAGIISGKGRNVLSPRGDIDLPDLLQTDAAINLGNSGGALINLKGEVVGIPTAIVRAAQAEGLGFAVPIDRAKEVVQQILKYGHARHPWLGVLYATVTQETPAPAPADRKGALVLQVAPNNPAARAGIRKGDIIRRAGNKEIINQNDLRDLAREQKVGASLPIVLWRAGQELKATIIVGEMPQTTELRKLFPPEK